MLAFAGIYFAIVAVFISLFKSAARADRSWEEGLEDVTTMSRGGRTRAVIGRECHRTQAG